MVQPAASARIVILDALRGIAAVWVVIFSICVTPGTSVIAPAFLRAIVESGGMAASFFIVLSAFCLCLASDRNPSRSLFEFYLKRACRILPLFYTVLFVQSLRIVFEYRATLSYDLVLSNAMLFFNFIPKWQEGIVGLSGFLGVLSCLYFLFPLLWSKAGYGLPECVKVVGACLIISVISQSCINYFPEGDRYWSWIFLRYLPSFCVGIISYLVWRDVYGCQVNKSQGAAYLTVGAALFVLLIFGHVSELIVPLLGETISFALIILGAALHQPVQGSSQSLFSKIGLVSYSVYLIHPLVIFSLLPFYKYIGGRLLSDSLLFFVAVSATLAVVGVLSVLSRKYIEQAGESLGNKIIERYNLVLQQKSPLTSISEQ